MKQISDEQERIATIGGTFDTIHIGHKEYIQLAFEYSDHVLIYVSSDNYIAGRKNYGSKPYRIRVQLLKEFIREIGYEKRCEIRLLETQQNLENDLLNEKIDIVIISPEYYDFFLKINYKRESKGMRSFLILVKTRTHFQGIDISSKVTRCMLPKNRSLYEKPLEYPSTLTYQSKTEFRKT